MNIKIKGEYLDMPSGIRSEIEELSPIFNDRGTQTMPITVPATPRNLRALCYPTRLDCTYTPAQGADKVEVECNGMARWGVINVISASSAGIEINIGFDNSVAYNTWKNNRLADLSTAKATCLTGGVAAVISSLQNIFRYGNPAKDPVAVFPVLLGAEGTGADICREVLNAHSSTHVLSNETMVKRIIDNTLTEVTVPAGYGISPFLRAWKVIELIFSNLGLTVENNMFQSDSELARLVVLNNTADTCCTGKVVYADLMPDCTVEEFLNSLWVRFGLTYMIDYDNSRVRLDLIRNIVDRHAWPDLTPYTTGLPSITYASPRYIKLSAQTSIDGAAPACERFEDFIKGAAMEDVAKGDNIAGWNSGGIQDAWDGDVREDWGQYDDYDPQDPDYPDPPDPDYDDRDDDTGRDDEERDAQNRDDYGDDIRRAAARTTPAATAVVGREFSTSNWYRLDPHNSRVKNTSTPFFNWDPQPDGLEVLELSSCDEWVTMAGFDHMGLMPYFNVGSRHLHTYIRGNDCEDSSDGETCPLAFMLAFTLYGDYTVGRYCSENGVGEPYLLSDRTYPRMSLLFQFADGLFARFWQRYDEVLRHAVRSVEMDARVSVYDIPGKSMLTPLRLRGVPCLVDSIQYSLDNSAMVSATYKLRVLAAQGSYDIAAEQNVPAIVHGARRLQWFLKSETFEGIEELQENLAAAAAAYVKESGYRPRDNSTGPEDRHFDEWCVDFHGAEPVSATRDALRWDNDPTVPPCLYVGRKLDRTYQAVATYRIYETHYINGRASWEVLPALLGTVKITVQYKVTIVARWVVD